MFNDTEKIYRFWILFLFFVPMSTFTYFLFLSTGGTSTGAPVCLSVLDKNLEIGLVIIVYTPVLSTMCRIWFIINGSMDWILEIN